MTTKSVEARRNGPPFTAVSNAFIDWLMADCTGSEVQVFLYLSRRIEGTEKGRRNGCDSISVSQICHGIRKVNETVLDRGTGLGVEAAVAALAQLEAKGIVIRKRGAGPKADTYSLTPEKAAAELKAGGGKHSEKPSGKHSENRNGGTRKIRTLTTQEIENTKQRRKESHHQEES